MGQQVFIFDTTLRDGEQVPGCKLNTKEKLALAVRLEELGVDILEAGFPVSSPGDFESVNQIAKTLKNTVVCGLSRAVQNDIEVAAAALKPAKRFRIHTGIGTSDLHIKYKFNATREEIIERAVSAVKLARNFTDDVEFYAEDAGRTDNEYLAQVCQVAIDDVPVENNVELCTFRRNEIFLPPDILFQVKFLSQMSRHRGNDLNIHSKILELIKNHAQTHSADFRGLVRMLFFLRNSICPLFLCFLFPFSLFQYTTSSSSSIIDLVPFSCPN